MSVTGNCSLPIKSNKRIIFNRRRQIHIIGQVLRPQIILKTDFQSEKEARNITFRASFFAKATPKKMDFIHVFELLND
jgi:hypothetical protein